jgi:hypothetical protein
MLCLDVTESRAIFTHGLTKVLNANKSRLLSRADRKLLRQLEESEGDVPFTLWLPLGERLSYCFSRSEITAAIEAAAIKALERLACQPIPPGRLLSSPSVPASVRSRAARSMLSLRGGKATAAKMRPLGFPNLVKARETLRRKAVECRAKADPQ